MKKTIIIILLLLPLIGAAQNKELILKAGFLEKFAIFTQWPENRGMSDTTQPFIISVIGKSPIGDVLFQIYKGYKIKNKPVKIMRFSSVDSIGGCHILFIAVSEEEKLDKIIAKAAENSILTISDTDGFGKRGVLINLYITEKGTLHFKINKKRLDKSTLHLNLMLLEIAKLI